MRVLVFGMGKAGTTALLYKVAAGLPGCQVFSGGTPKLRPGISPLVCKHTINFRKGRDFALIEAHIREAGYDRVVWITRDPRDLLVSETLFHWHKGVAEGDPMFAAYWDLLIAKEANPGGVALLDIARHCVAGGVARSRGDVADAERERYRAASEFLERSGSACFRFKFEDMVQGRFEALEGFLGFPVGRETEIVHEGRSKVVRHKSAGDWRHWFTPGDIELLSDAYNPFLLAAGYGDADWILADPQELDPRFGTAYVTTLLDRARARASGAGDPRGRGASR